MAPTLNIVDGDLLDQPVEVIVNSPLRRAQETAALALPLTPRMTLSVLRELEASRIPTFVDPTDDAALDALLPAPLESTESGAAFMTWVTGWLNALPHDGTVLAVTHFAVIREVLARLFGFRRAPQCVDFTAIFRVSVGPHQCDALAWNDTSHLSTE